MAVNEPKVNDNVLAKWPGSRSQFMAAVIQNKSSTGYVVKFSQDGSVATVGLENMRPLDEESSKPLSKDSKLLTKARSKSPARPRAKSPAKPRIKSPIKSPAKSPAKPRSKSPAKLQAKSPSKPKLKSPSKSPARSRSSSHGRKTERSQSRSPARIKASPKKAALSRSPAKTPAKKTERSRSRSKTRGDSKSKASPQSPARKRGRPTEKSSSLVEMSPETSPITSPKTSKRGRPITLKNKILDHGKSTLEFIPLLKKVDPKNKVQAILEEEDEVRKIYSTRSQTSVKLQLLDEKLPAVAVALEKSAKMKAGILGIIFSTLSILLMPVFTILLALACVRKRVGLLSIPQLPKTSGAYFSYEGAGVYLGFILFQALLSALPVGRVVKGFQYVQGKVGLRYRLNGIHALFANVLLLAVAIYFDQPVYFVHDNFFKLSCIATGFSFLISIALYFRALYQPASQISQFGCTGCLPYDFHHGREVNPRFGSLFDLKLLLVRTGLIGWFVVNGCLLYKAYLLNSCVTYEQALVASAQGLYILFLLYREEELLATAAVMYEGLGFGMAMATCATAPFTFTVPLYYLVHFKPNLPFYCLGGMLLIYALGLRISRKSLNNKMTMKRNPEDSSLATMNTIRSLGKKPLLAAGWWGFVRHPNYTAEVLMFIAWTLPCGFQNAVPYMPVLLVFLSLVRRCFQVEAIMAHRYQDAFSQYKHRVPYRMCPKIF